MTKLLLHNAHGGYVVREFDGEIAALKSHIKSTTWKTAQDAFVFAWSKHPGVPVQCVVKGVRR